MWYFLQVVVLFYPREKSKLQPHCVYHHQDVASLTQAKELLIQQKLDIQTQLDGLQGESGRLTDQMTR